VHIDVVEGVDPRPVAPVATEEFSSPPGDNLVKVHIGGGSRASLKGVDHDLVDQLASGDFGAGIHDRSPNVERQKFKQRIGFRAGMFNLGKSPDKGWVQSVTGKGKIVYRALGMNPPIGFGRYFQRAKSVRLRAVSTFGEIVHDAA